MHGCKTVYFWTTTSPSHPQSHCLGVPLSQTSHRALCRTSTVLLSHSTPGGTASFISHPPSLDHLIRCATFPERLSGRLILAQVVAPRQRQARFGDNSREYVLPTAILPRTEWVLLGNHPHPVDRRGSTQPQTLNQQALPMLLYSHMADIPHDDRSNSRDDGGCHQHVRDTDEATL